MLYLAVNLLRTELQQLTINHAINS